MNALRAYPTLLRVGFAGAVAYRAELVVWMLTMTMPLVSLALWSAVAANAPVGRFGTSDFVAYFLIALLVRQLTGSWVVWELVQEIKTGTLANRLLKPIHPFVAYSADNLASLPIRMLLAVPITLVVCVGGRLHLVDEPYLVAAFLVSLLGAWFITFFVMALIGTLSFFIDSSAAIFEIWFACFMLFSGYLVPLDLLPGWIRQIAHCLPFRYTLSFPVEVLTGAISPDETLRGLMVQWSYCLVCYTAAMAIWHVGVRRFGTFGG